MRRLDRIDKKLNELLASRKAEKQWVKASDILRLTGWTADKLRYRRQDGLIEFKKTEKGWFYNATSIPSALLLK